jgi:hypothetical protein
MSDLLGNWKKMYLKKNNQISNLFHKLTTKHNQFRYFYKPNIQSPLTKQTKNNKNKSKPHC